MSGMLFLVNADYGKDWVHDFLPALEELGNLGEAAHSSDVHFDTVIARMGCDCFFARAIERAEDEFKRGHID